MVPKQKKPTTASVTATVSKGNGKKEKMEQGEFDNFKPKTIEKIEKAAKAYVRARDEWMKLHEPMMKAQERLGDVMRSELDPDDPNEKKTRPLQYVYTDENGKRHMCEVVEESSEKVKVRAVKSGSKKKDKKDGSGE